MELIRGKKLLKQIFAEHRPQFVSEHPDLRPAILKNVDKMLKCGTEDMGFHLNSVRNVAKKRKSRIPANLGSVLPAVLPKPTSGLYVIYNLERSGRLLNNWHYVYSELVYDVLFQRSRARLYIMNVRQRCLPIAYTSMSSFTRRLNSGHILALAEHHILMPSIHQSI